MPQPQALQRKQHMNIFLKREREEKKAIGIYSQRMGLDLIKRETPDSIWFPPRQH